MNRNTKWIVLVGILVIVFVAVFMSVSAWPATKPSPSVIPAASTAGVSLSPVITTATVAPFLQATSTQPKITWSENTFGVFLSPGDSTLRYLRFSSDLALQSAVVEPVPELTQFVSLQPSTAITLGPNQTQVVRVVFAIPAPTVIGTYEGPIHVKVAEQTLPQTVKITISVVPPRPITSTVTMGVAGGPRVLPNGAAFSISPGSLASDVTFNLSTYTRDSLPHSINVALSIYSNVEIRPQLPNTRLNLLTDSYTAFVTVPLVQQAPRGSTLVVLRQQEIGKALVSTGDILTVAADGASATFQTHEIGLFLLVSDSDKGLENVP